MGPILGGNRSQAVSQPCVGKFKRASLQEFFENIVFKFGENKKFRHKFNIRPFEFLKRDPLKEKKPVRVELPKQKRPYVTGDSNYYREYESP
ncbi:hypothetical protein CEXT_634521 [Caerostris extrusa]|uniref:Uncharacterized protein n=1 Tax=Caerostris extrusa TaxID=172846 RepID=A0AAV4R9L1_CAEEX|nr:hypothetical protein CEXT_634521 [Caerostris extrusa]